MTVRRNNPPGVSASTDLNHVKQAIRELQERVRDEWDPEKERRMLRAQVRLEEEGALRA